MKILNKNTAKFLASFALFMVVTIAVLGVHEAVFAAVAPINQLEEVLGNTGLTGGGATHKLASVDPGADILTSIIFKTIDFIKYLIGAIAVLYIIISGIKLISSTTKIDEYATKEKDNIKHIIYGLVFIMMADQLVKKVFFGEYGECLASASAAQQCATVGGGFVKGVYGLMLAIIGSTAIFVIVLSAFRLITSLGEEETINKEKKRITTSIIGLLVAGLGEFVIKDIIFPKNGQAGIDVAGAQKLVVNFTNFIAAFIGVGAFGMLFYAGWLYVTSAGNEEQTGKAKKVIISAVIGIIIAFAAFGAVSTFTSFTSGRELNLPGTLPGLPSGEN